LCVGGQQAGRFGGDAPGLLTKLANSAAIALENARLYQQAERVAMVEERQRIAAEIHDGLAQTLNYLPLKAELVAQNIQAGQNQEALEMLDRMAEAVVRASHEVRQAIANLQEGRLHQATLPERLAEMVQELDADGKPSIVFIPTQPAPWPLAARESDAVLKVVREAVQNACRHAQAEHITIRLERRGDEMTVFVEDDGRGFDPAAPLLDETGHFGLSIMRARAARLGGRLTVHSTPGRGTQVVLSWPVDDRRRRS
jgi:signal transduction histidine kinase